MANKQFNQLIIILCLVPLFLFWHWFEPAARKNRQGIKAYEAEKYEEALNRFLSAKGINPESDHLKSNTASALYRMDKFKEALDEFSRIDPEKTHLSKSHFHYNLGNSFFKLQQFDKALENYKQSIVADPSDIDAKKNFEIALKKMEEQNKKDQQDKDKKQDKEKEKDKEKQQDQKQDQKKDQQDQKKEEQQQEQQQKPQEKHKNVMRYLDQNEKEQMKKQKRRGGKPVRVQKDW